MQKKRVEELEYHFKQFPNVPPEVIVKEDLLRLGMNFSDAAIDAAKGSPLIRGTLFTQIRVKPEELGRGEIARTPEDLCINGGPYELRRTIVMNRLNPHSPYLVDVVDGRAVLCADGIVMAQVKFSTMPKYFSKKFDDGTLYSEVLPVRSWGTHAFNNVYRVCQFWGANEECKFCDINENARQRAKHGVGWTRKQAYKSVEQVAEVAEEIFLREKTPGDIRPLFVLIIGGTILGKIAGKTEDEFYLQYVEAIRARIGNRWPIWLQTGAKDKKTCKRYRDAGVTAHGANIEVWDKDLFKVICPGKDKYVGREEWIKRVVESVDVFGEGNVIPNFVLGVEMCQPYGFKDVASAVKSTREGFEYLMSHGVTPRYESWNISPTSALAGNQPPPLEFFIRADEAWCELMNKYSLPLIPVMGPVGPGRGICMISCLHDMDPVKCVG